MTNEEAKAIISNEYKCVDRDCDIERSCGKCDLMMPNKEPILKAYKLAIETLEQTTWIPVSERLPEENETVLINYCRLNEHSVRMAIWDELHCRFYNSEYTKYVSVDFVTAWMPLPEPYKGE